MLAASTQPGNQGPAALETWHTISSLNRRRPPKGSEPLALQGHPLRTWISVLPPSSRRMARPMLSWKIFSFLVLVMRSHTSLVAPSLSSRHWVAAIADQSWSGPGIVELA